MMLPADLEMGSGGQPDTRNKRQQQLHGLLRNDQAEGMHCDPLISDSKKMLVVTLASTSQCAEHTSPCRALKRRPRPFVPTAGTFMRGLNKCILLHQLPFLHPVQPTPNLHIAPMSSANRPARRLRTPVMTRTPKAHHCIVPTVIHHVVAHITSLLQWSFITVRCTHHKQSSKPDPTAADTDTALSSSQFRQLHPRFQLCPVLHTS